MWRQFGRIKVWIWDFTAEVKEEIHPWAKFNFGHLRCHLASKHKYMTGLISYSCEQLKWLFDLNGKFVLFGFWDGNEPFCGGSQE